jgi:hypothetical protein
MGPIASRKPLICQLMAARRILSVLIFLNTSQASCDLPIFPRQLLTPKMRQTIYKRWTVSLTTVERGKRCIDSQMRSPNNDNARANNPACMNSRAIILPNILATNHLSHPGKSPAAEYHIPSVAAKIFEFD